MGYHLLFFLLLPGGPGMKGLLSPPAACCMSAGAPPPGIFPMVASVTIVAPSLMPLIISVLMPLEMPTVTGCAVNVFPSRVQSLWGLSQSFTMSFSPISGLSGVKRGARAGAESASLRSSV